jgi:hypothetical protein
MDNMLSPTAKIWTAKVATSQLMNVAFDIDANQRVVNQEAFRLAQDLRNHLLVFDVGAEIALSLKESDRDPRLARGMNELGLIKPDFGKPFQGLYFDALTIQVAIGGKNLKQKKEFLEPYLRHRVIQFLIQHPTPYSNWEFSWKNRQAPNPYHGIQTSRSVNFPSIQVAMISKVGKTS